MAGERQDAAQYRFIILASSSSSLLFFLLALFWATTDPALKPLLKISFNPTPNATVSQQCQKTKLNSIFPTCRSAPVSNEIFTLGSPSIKKVTKLQTLSVAPLAPPRHLRTQGSRFSKIAYQRSLPFSGEPILFIRNSSILVLSDHS